MPPIDPCRGVLELPDLGPKVCRVEEESTVLVPKLGIPYEKGELVMFYVNGAVIAAIDRIGPLSEVEAVETMVAQTGDGWLGGGTPLIVTIMERM